MTKRNTLRFLAYFSLTVFFSLAFLDKCDKDSSHERMAARSQFYSLGKLTEKYLENKSNGYVMDVNNWIKSVATKEYSIPTDQPGFIKIFDPFPGVLRARDYYIRTNPPSDGDDVLLYDSIIFRGDTRFRLYANGRYDYADMDVTDGRYKKRVAR